MNKWHGGKGSSRRKGADDKKFAQNYDKIFGKKEEPEMVVEIWGKPACPFCVKAKQLAENLKMEYVYKELDVDFTREQIFEEFPTARTFPQIRVNGKAIGGYDEFATFIETTNFNGSGFTL